MNDIVKHEMKELEAAAHGSDKEQGNSGHDKGTIIKVNEQPVTLTGKTANGMQIKTAAIAQGVHIQQNFVLQEELPNGTSKIIGDTDEVKLHPNLTFTAIAPDDNS
ncbi:MAG TPA: multiubiquitin domain-containing protein [Noviherbaspirillum sp.]|nr:multiubiquitin domain-containing protein [Noviherbaspirillum sp.]